MRRYDLRTAADYVDDNHDEDGVGWLCISSFCHTHDINKN